VTVSIDGHGFTIIGTLSQFTGKGDTGGWASPKGPPVVAGPLFGSKAFSIGFDKIAFKLVPFGTAVDVAPFVAAASAALSGNGTFIPSAASGFNKLSIPPLCNAHKLLLAQLSLNIPGEELPYDFRVDSTALSC
jgi:hypothetical protein